MRPTLRLLQIATNGSQRQRSVSFVGLGRMGSEMAFNLFSRRLVESNGTARFVVCDAREATSAAFVRNFMQQFPGAQIEVASTPAEYVTFLLLYYGRHTWTHNMNLYRLPSHIASYQGSACVEHGRHHAPILATRS